MPIGPDAKVNIVVYFAVKTLQFWTLDISKSIRVLTLNAFPQSFNAIYIFPFVIFAWINEMLEIDLLSAFQYQ